MTPLALDAEVGMMATDWEQLRMEMDALLDTKCSAETNCPESDSVEGKLSGLMGFIHTGVAAMRRQGPINVIRTLYAKGMNELRSRGPKAVLTIALQSFGGSVRVNNADGSVMSDVTAAHTPMSYDKPDSDDACVLKDVSAVILCHDHKNVGKIQGNLAKMGVVKPFHFVMLCRDGDKSNSVVSAVNEAIASDPRSNVMIISDQALLQAGVITSMALEASNVRTGAVGCTASIGGDRVGSGYYLVPSSANGSPFDSCPVDPDAVCEVDILSPSIVVLSKRVLCSVGMFDTSYDSMDWALGSVCIKMRQQGFWVVTIPTQQVLLDTLKTDGPAFEADQARFLEEYGPYIQSNYYCTRIQGFEQLSSRDRHSILVVGDVNYPDALTLNEGPKFVYYAPISSFIESTFAPAGIHVIDSFMSEDSAIRWLNSYAILFDKVILVGVETKRTYLNLVAMNTNAEIICFDTSDAFEESRVII